MLGNPHNLKDKSVVGGGSWATVIVIINLHLPILNTAYRFLLIISVETEFILLERSLKECYWQQI